MKDGTIAVVGASAAGISAAETLRAEGFGGSLVVIGDEPHLPYERPPLSKQVLTGEWGEDRLAMRDAEALARCGIDMRLGVRATGLDVGARRLTLDDGGRVEFDGLLIATGVRSRTLTGAEGLSGVHTLRTLDDVTALRERLSTRETLAVIGSGPLGMEVAASLAQSASHEVSVVTDETTPMERVFGAEVGRVLGGIHQRMGVTLHTGQTVAGLERTAGEASAIRLADGTKILADTVLVAIGSAPNTEWLDGSGLPVRDGVECDAYCAAAPRVYVAGDVANRRSATGGRGVRMEHRMNATEQGAAAARNLLSEIRGTNGSRAVYTPVPYFWSDQYALKPQAHGILRGAERVEIVYQDLGSADRPRVAALYVCRGLVTGVLGIRIPPRILRALRELIVVPKPLGAVRSQADHVLSAMG
ncbi:NAD(P)/FAD-dependent oxidoreductase [Streptomyces nitrosporeus]|uniref:NAD(P)/FAD-dependent oxidoreductase n=1 Tax=Streptomyces nitrosporeus TaxID=28894 RepID=UPI0039A09A98